MDTSTPYKDSNISETYQQMLLSSNQSNQQNNSTHSIVSAFSAISSFQDVLNVASPLLSAPQTTVINSPQNVLAGSSKTQQPHVVIQTALTSADSIQHGLSGTATLPSTIIVNDSGIVNSAGAPAIITFALANDSTSTNLGTASSYSSVHQPSHVVLDVGNVTGNRFITLNTNHSNPQNNSLIINTSVPASTISELTSITTPVIISAPRSQNISQFSHQLGTYSNNGNNMLVQVDQKNSQSSFASNFSSYSTSSLSLPKVLSQQNKDISSSVPCIVSPHIENNSVLSSNADICTENQQYNLSSVTTVNANSVSSNSASLSQRNLQAILDAIRHIEGGSISTAAAVAISANSSSSSSCTQASDLLVR